MRIVNTLLFVVIFIVGVFSLNKHSMNEVQPAAFLPSDTLLYIEQKKGAEAIQRIRSSRIGKVFASIDFVKVLQDTEVDPAYVEIVDKSIATISKLQSDRLIHEILGKRCALAMFAQREWSANSASVKDFIGKHLLLISKPRINEETLNALIATYTGGRKMTEVPFGKYLIRRFYIDDEMLSMVFIDGVIIASLEERILRESLEIYDKKNGSLKTNKDFQSLTKELEGADQKFYIAIEGLQDLMQYGASKTSNFKEREVISELSSLKGLKAISYGAWQSKTLLKNRLLVRLNREKMDSLVREMIDTSPSINFTLPFVAKDVLLYYWSNTLNIRLLWEMYVSEAGDNNLEVEALRKNISHISGYEIEDIIKMISSNVSILIKKNKRDQFVPIPDFALLMRLKDSKHIQDVISKSLNKLDIKVQSGKYKDIEYYYWGIYPQESLQPVYAIHRDYLILANTLDILQTIIDTPVNNSRLIAAPGFKDLDPGFQTLNNSVCYIDQANLLSHLREFISWAGTILAIQDRQAAEKSKVLIDNLINPLFLGMAMYEKSATRTYMKDDRIVIESQTRIVQ